MRNYATVSPQFWIGETGQQLRKDADAQRLAIYLMTCPNSNMIGLYYLPIPVICHELGMMEKRVRELLSVESGSPSEGASKGHRRGILSGFCDYDGAFEVIFVVEMARFQCGPTISSKDKRKPALKALLNQHRKCRLYKDFHDRYGLDYGLEMEPENKPHRRGIEGACNVRPQDQEQEQKQETENPPTPQGGQVVPTVVVETTTATDTESAKATPPPTDAPTTTRKTRTPAAAVPSPVIPANLDTPDFRTTWEWWQADRKERKKPMTAHAMELQLAKLAKYPTLDAIEMLVNSITNGWAGLFPLDVKGKNYGNGNRTGTVGRLGRAESRPGESYPDSTVSYTEAEVAELAADDERRMQAYIDAQAGPNPNGTPEHNTTAGLW